MTRQATTVDVRRSGDRFHTETSWLDSHHSFSFGQHYDPDDTHFGLLLVSNDDVVLPGHRVRDAPAPRHGDRDLGARRRPRAPGLAGALRRHLPRPRAADDRRDRHPAQREERLLAADRRSPSTATPCTSCRCGCCRTRRCSSRGTSSSRSPTPTCAAGSPSSPRGWTGTGTRPRSASSSGTPRCRPHGSTPATSSSCRRRRSSTCTSRGARSTWRAPAGWARATRRGSPTPTGSGSPPVDGPAEVLVWEMHGRLA